MTVRINREINNGINNNERESEQRVVYFFSIRQRKFIIACNWMTMTCTNFLEHIICKRHKTSQARDSDKVHAFIIIKC